jgi:TolB-like protein
MEKAAIETHPELVKQQLRHLLDQGEFKRSPVLSRFLEFVVLTKLAGREEEIKEYTIGIKALGRPVDFNPQLDSIVRIHASRLRNVLSSYYYKAGQHSPIIIDIPKGTYIPVFEKNGEQNTNGHNGHKKNGTVPSVNGKESQLNGHAIALTPKIFSPKPVLAVLPFHDLSSEQSSANFLVTLGEELCSELAKFDNVSVISYYVTRELDAALNHLKDLKNIGIDYIVTGSTRLLGGSVKFSVQLIQVEGGNVLWSESFLSNHSKDEVFNESQDESIRQIANAIVDGSKIFSTSTHGQSFADENPVRNAINHYFDYSYDYNSQKFETTLNATEQAYEIANDNALVVSILSKLYLDQYACAIEQDKDLLEKGLQLAHKSVALAPRSQYAQKALAWGLILAGDDQQAEEAISRCISVNPYAGSSLGTLGLGLIMRGEYKNGYSMLLQALKFQHNVSACAKLGFCLYYYHEKNFSECKKWVSVLSPFDIPFSRLLDIALEGNVKEGSILRNDVLPNIKENRQDIIQRIVHDPKLRDEIAEGWQLAGLQ